MPTLLHEWKKENLRFQYFPVWIDIPGVDQEFAYSRWKPKNIMEIRFNHSYAVGTANSFLHLFSLGIVPGFQDNTWSVDLKIYDAQGILHQVDPVSYDVSEIRSSLFFPIWLTGYRSDYRPIMEEILKKSLLMGRAYIQENSIPFQAGKNSQQDYSQATRATNETQHLESIEYSLPILKAPISIQNTELECNVHLHERGTPNLISYHPPVGQGGLCRWSVVFYNHTEEEIELKADEFRMILKDGKETQPFTRIFVRTTVYNEGASTSNKGIRILDSLIRVPSHSKASKKTILGNSFPFTKYTFYFPFQETEKILSMESAYKSQVIGIRFQ